MLGAPTTELHEIRRVRETEGGYAVTIPEAAVERSGVDPDGEVAVTSAEDDLLVLLPWDDQRRAVPQR